jgi:TPR repeat protein
VLCGAALLSVLVPRLLCLQGESGVRKRFHLAQRMASRRHFLGSYKDEAEGVFEEGQRLYGEQRFSEAAERWGRTALLQHGPSHAHVSDMLIDGRPGVAVDYKRAYAFARAGVAKDEKRAFVFASAGAALGCAHSKGVLGLCYVWGIGVAEDEARGLVLGRESAAAGSCFGQYVVGVCYEGCCGGVAHDYAEAVRLYRLAAEQGHASAQFQLGNMFEHGDAAETIRWYRLAAQQGHAEIQFTMGRMFQYGVAKDAAEAIRWYHLAAEQGHAEAQFTLGFMFDKGEGVAQDTAEAIQWYRLAAEQGDDEAERRLDALVSRSRKRASGGA